MGTWPSARIRREQGLMCLKILIAKKKKKRNGAVRSFILGEYLSFYPSVDLERLC